MKIDKVLFVSDENINYLSFWNSISKHFKERLGLQPKLFFLGSRNNVDNSLLSEKYGEVEEFNVSKDYPIIIQALWAKLWLTQKESDTNWLIGDIDLYPLNLKYYKDAAEKVPEGCYGHLNADGYKAGPWYTVPHLGLPGYYHFASGRTFKSMLGLTDDFVSEVKYIYESRKYGAAFRGIHIPDRVRNAIKTNYEYICCEEHLSTDKLMPVKDKIYGFTYPSDMIRLEHPSQFNFKNMENIIDFHCPRPYHLYSTQVENILDSFTY